MTADLYCTRGDVNRWISSGSIAHAGRLVESSLAASDVLTLDGHGFETDDALTVRATEGGTLSAPLAEGTTYYAIRLTNATFKIAASAAGAAINITSNGVSMIATREPPYDAVIEYYSRWADAFLPAEAAPLAAPIHPTVKGIVAQLSAKALQNIDGKSSAVVDAAELAAKAMLERYAAGLPLRSAAGVTSTRTNKAHVATVTNAVPDQRGWGSETIP